ncbi:MAG: MBL fold metallo-hydrolase, partial [bacterium]|nr:MBL fold metallo-hydrolase [bacterium]
MRVSKLTFCGGTGAVTGANFLLEYGESPEGGKLLVDCGSYQGDREMEKSNAMPFPYDPKSVGTLLVTHAHQDHIGRIPKLVRDGFCGVIHSTPATRDLSEVMFEDALGIMERHAQQFGREPLYAKEDVERALSLWQTRDYHDAFVVGDADAMFLDAGHILGSALVRLSRSGRTILFTGDLGNTPEPLLRDTEHAESSGEPHYIVMESVYGDRLHEGRAERREFLRTVIEDVRRRSGVLLIPSFSIERTQVLLYELNSMVEDGQMRSLPIYLDSPLARRVTDVFRKYPKLFNGIAQARIESGDDLFSFPGLEVIKNTGESRAIHKTRNPKIIIAGAGMSSGGRIRSHEREYLGDKNATVLFVGYQTPGSLGRRIQDGTREVEIDGTRVKVRAQIER